MRVYRKGPVELRLGDYRDVLADVEPDAVITDPPYSEWTHAGHDLGATYCREDAVSGSGTPSLRRPLGFECWSVAQLEELADWAMRASGWAVALLDHDSVQDWLKTMDRERYTFSPLACVELGSRCRLAGDGPSQWSVFAGVARPRSRVFMSWGTLPGAYVVPREAKPLVGGKPLALMRAIVRDYSRPGDLVCDPCAGGATTLIAAALEGRRAIGAELDPETFEKACARIEQTALTPPLRGLDIEAVEMEQTGLGFGKGDDE